MCRIPLSLGMLLLPEQDGNKSTWLEADSLWITCLVQFSVPSGFSINIQRWLQWVFWKQCNAQVCMDLSVELIWLEKKESSTEHQSHTNCGPRQTWSLCDFFVSTCFPPAPHPPQTKWRPTAHICHSIKLTKGKAEPSHCCQMFLEGIICFLNQGINCFLWWLTVLLQGPVLWRALLWKVPRLLSLCQALGHSEVREQRCKGPKCLPEGN